MCNCIAEMDSALKEHNTQLIIPIVLMPETHDMQASRRMVIATEKIENRKRKGPVNVFASFCPFCGEKYPD